MAFMIYMYHFSPTSNGVTRILPGAQSRTQHISNHNLHILQLSTCPTDTHPLLAGKSNALALTQITFSEKVTSQHDFIPKLTITPLKTITSTEHKLQNKPWLTVGRVQRELNSKGAEVQTRGAERGSGLIKVID